MKQKKPKDGLDAPVWVRFEPELSEWLRKKAAKDGNRTIASMLRKIVADAKRAERPAATGTDGAA